MKLAAMMMLVCLSGFAQTDCLAQVGNGQTQPSQQLGPIRLEEVPTTPREQLYTLNAVKCADTKTARYIWFLQRQAYLRNEVSELHSTAYGSLNSPALRQCIAHFPKNAEIIYSRLPPAETPTSEIQGPNGPEKGLQDFIKFCRDNKIHLVFGLTF